MQFHYFDLIVGSIILLLGLKGILNGLIKELFGLIGIVGGLFIASRLSYSVGSMVSELIFHFDNSAAISFTGFLITLLIFWSAMIALGVVFKRLSLLSGLGPIDKILGFVFGSGKFFFIGSVIAFALYNINAVRVNLEPVMKQSFLFEAMVKSGQFIMHIDTAHMDKTLDDMNDTIKEKAGDLVQKSETVHHEIEQLRQEVIEHIPDDIKEKKTP